MLAHFLGERTRYLLLLFEAVLGAKHVDSEWCFGLSLTAI